MVSSCCLRAKIPLALIDCWSPSVNVHARTAVNVDVGIDSAQLLRASSVHILDGDVDRAVDSAAYAYSLARDNEERCRAAVALARGLEEKALTADVVDWCDRALQAVPGDREALAVRGYAHFNLGRTELALIDLDAAVAGTPDQPVPGVAAFNRALVLHRLGRRAEALEALDGALTDPVYRRYALRARGVWRLTEADPTGAAADLTEAAIIGDRPALSRLLEFRELPDDPRVWLTRLHALRAADETAEAVALAELMLAREDLDPSIRAQVLDERGLLAGHSGDWDAAGTWLELAAELAPEDGAIMTNWGRALYLADRDDEALPVLLHATELQPKNGRAERFLGDLFAFAERFVEANMWYERALAITPLSSQALNGQAVALTGLGRRSEAREPARQAAIAGDEDAIAWCAKNDIKLPADAFEAGQFTLRLNNPLSADYSFRVAAEGWLSASHGPGDFCARHAAMALANAAVCKSALGDRTGAESLVRRALRLRPALRDGWNTLGNQLTALGRLSEAIEAFERCAWCDPFYAGAHYGRAEALRRLGRGAAAVAALDRAIAIGYDSDTAKQRDLYFRRARTHQALGHWDEAIADYRCLVEDSAGTGADPRSAADHDEVYAMLAGVEEIRALAGASASAWPAPAYRSYGLDPVHVRDADTAACRIELRDPPDAATRVAIALALAAAGTPATGPATPEPTSTATPPTGPATPKPTSTATPAPGPATPGLTSAARREGVAWQAPGPARAERAPTLWSDRFALVRLADPDTDLRALVEAVHAVAPVVEAVNLRAIGVNTGDPAEAWSVATQPVPDAGPEFGEYVAFWVGRLADTTRFPEPVADPAVSAALWETAAEVVRRRAQQRLAESVDEVAAGAVLLVPVEDRALPEPQGWRYVNDFKRDPDDTGWFAPDGTGVMLRRHEGYYTGLDRVTADGRVSEVIPTVAEAPLLARHIEAISVSPDGRWALYAVYLGRQLWYVDLDTGTTGYLFESDRKISTTAFLSGTEVLVKSETQLRVYSFDSGSVDLLAAAPVGAGHAVTCRNGRIIVCGAVSAPELVVFGWCDGVLARIAEISAEVSSDAIRSAGDRAFVSERVTYEIANLDLAWERFATWVREQKARAGASTGVVVEECYEAPSHRINEAPEAIRQVTAPAVDWDWRPDYQAVVVVAQGRAYEADLVERTARPLVSDVDLATYTAEGCAVVRDDELVLYRWPHGSSEPPTESGRIWHSSDVGELTWAYGGRVLVVTGGGRTSFLAVHNGSLYPVGALDGDDWFAIWNHGQALYLQSGYEWGDEPVRRFRATGFETAVPAALKVDAVDRLNPAELSTLPARQLDRYPGLTRWSLSPL
jgi:tetratricopeptide (TPR) repeat protein